MSEAPLTEKNVDDHRSVPELNLLDVLTVLAKRKKILIGIPLLVAVLAIGVTFLLPLTYRATATLLPPQQPQSAAAAMLSQLGGMAGAAGTKGPGDIYVSMLKSRTIANRVIERHALGGVYETHSPEKTRAMLERNTAIAVGKEGLLSIAVEDKDPRRAAVLANSYVDELTRLTRVLAVTEATQRRVFFEKQLEGAKNKLAQAELTLKNTLGTQGVVSVDASSQAIVQTGARLRAMVSTKEIELDAMRAFVTPSNPEYRRVQEELNSVRRELSTLENGSGEPAGGGVAGGGLKSIQVLRDLKYYQMLYELLAKQYEAARLEEAREVPVVQVLDPAVEPESASWPRRGPTGAIAFVIAFLASLGLVFLNEARQNDLADPVRGAKWSQLKRYLKRW